jgi:hypothetical protein
MVAPEMAGAGRDISFSALVAVSGNTGTEQERAEAIRQERVPRLGRHRWVFAGRFVHADMKKRGGTGIED